MREAGGQALRVPGEGRLMRIVFAVYLVVIVVGLACFLVLGLRNG